MPAEDSRSWRSINDDILKGGGRRRGIVRVDRGNYGSRTIDGKSIPRCFFWGGGCLYEQRIGYYSPTWLGGRYDDDDDLELHSRGGRRRGIVDGIYVHTPCLPLQAYHIHTSTVARSENESTCILQ